ncbi:MAG: type IV toxin-antitoxin system AbiEi family antitoxin domain-containing protein [Archangiaceae bacterium]|nr:type IV toxin-antitoxin system AbiEi family antitoxin domain-containing protein [Archangiaceae bacterium]
MHDFHTVEKLATRQGGAVSRRQLKGLGFDRVAIDNWVRIEHLQPAYRGVYRLPGSSRTEAQRLWEAVLWAGPSAFISHSTAAWRWRLDGYDRRPSRIDVCVAVTRPLTAPDSIAFHRARGLLPGRHTVLVDDVPCTSLARTVVDLAALTPASMLDALLDSAERRLRGTRESAARLLREAGTRGRAGAAALRELVEAPPAPITGSRLEDRARAVLRAAGLDPTCQQVVCDAAGKQIGRFDFGFPTARIVIEAQSRKFHDGWKARENDYQRSNGLESAGWRLFYVTWNDLRDAPDAFVGRIKAAIAEL